LVVVALVLRRRRAPPAARPAVGAIREGGRHGDQASLRARVTTAGGPPAEPVLQPGDTPGHPMAAWFADHRRVRPERYASRPDRIRSRGDSAVLTIAQNESLFLPVWLGYYSRFFNPDDVYVLDHDSDDGSTAAGDFVRIPISHEPLDNRRVVSHVEHHH